MDSSVPILALSMKQKRYNIATVGTIIKSIFSLNLASSFGSNVTSGWPYLHQYFVSYLCTCIGEPQDRTHLSVANWPRSAAVCRPVPVSWCT